MCADHRTIGVMEIVLVRHGEPEWVRNELNVVDPPLTDRGHMQAARMGEVLGRDRKSTRLNSSHT